MLNGLLFCAISYYHPAYLLDYKVSPNPDATHYVLLGHNIYEHGAYSRSENEPYVSDIFRTPGYPLFAGALELLGGPWLIYLSQVFIHIGLCCAVYALGIRALRSERGAFVGAMFCAVHPTLLVLNFQAMSEIPFVFLVTCAVLALSTGIRDAANPRSFSPAVAGILVGIAILVRPAGLHVPIILAIVLATALAVRSSARVALKRTCGFLMAVAICIAPWIIRNYVVFGTAALTTNDTIVLVYFTGAGAYQVHYGIDREQASRMIAEEYHLHSPEDMWNYHSKGLSPVEMDREARAAIFPILSRYPVDLMKSCALGLIKSLFSHDAGWLGRMLSLDWSSPGTGGLLKGDRSAWSALFSNHPLLVGILLLQIVVNGALVLLAFGGVVRFAWSREWTAVPSLVALLFFSLVCAASGIDAYTRFAAPLLPFACIFAGSCTSRRTRSSERTANSRDVR